jgi:hypothetical protein
MTEGKNPSQRQRGRAILLPDARKPVPVSTLKPNTTRRTASGKKMRLKIFLLPQVKQEHALPLSWIVKGLSP